MLRKVISVGSKLELEDPFLRLLSHMAGKNVLAVVQWPHFFTNTFVCDYLDFLAALRVSSKTQLQECKTWHYSEPEAAPRFLRTGVKNWQWAGQ